jgi:glycosyltransferase involved in cell wall biosynthesis
MPSPTYVLVTPVRDEFKTIGRTIESVFRQTCLPVEWVIVSDGSTDGTNEVIESASLERPWIRLLKLPPRSERSFAAVVRNTELGVEALEFRQFDYLGLLDADVEFEADYYERVLRCFEENPRLGLGGGVVIDLDSEPSRLPRNRIDVPGAVQFFRRECFASLGPLCQIPEGGWDCMTCVVARMSGFETRLFPELVVKHLKPRNAAEGGAFARQWKLGERDYALGYSPGFEAAKWLARALDSPVLVGALAALLGYASAAVRGRQRVVPKDVIGFMRKEQHERLRRILVHRSANAPR